MKVYLRDRDLIEELKDLKDKSLDNVIDSYNKLCISNAISIITLFIEAITVLILYNSYYDETILAVLSLTIIATVILGNIFSRFILGKNYYKYLKDNNITIIQNIVR